MLGSNAASALVFNDPVRRHDARGAPRRPARHRRRRLQEDGERFATY